MIDLHMHTIYSDGEYEPVELIKKCRDKGITTIAITDHNSMEGSRFAIKQNPFKDLKVISGIEFGAECPKKGGTLHILGYGLDISNTTLNDVAKAIMTDNVMRLESCVSLLKKHYDISFKQEDLEKVYSSIGNIGRPDIAKLCMKYGYTSTVQEAFVKYLNPIKDKIAKRRTSLSAKDCIDIITSAGGVSCLAHPILIGYDKEELTRYITYLANYGLKSVEVYHSCQDSNYSDMLLEITNRNNLLYSVGSDYHGPIVTPKYELGTGQNNNLCKNYATILQALE